MYKGGVEGVKERALSRLSQIKLKNRFSQQMTSASPPPHLRVTCSYFCAKKNTVLIKRAENSCRQDLKHHMRINRIKWGTISLIGGKEQNWFEVHEKETVSGQKKSKWQQEPACLITEWDSGSIQEMKMWDKRYHCNRFFTVGEGKIISGVTKDERS